MLYTRKGDGGTSGLFGTKDRLPKDNAVYEALGTVDELNSLLGYVRHAAARAGIEKAHRDAIEVVQQRLFIIEAELAGADKRIEEAQVAELETSIAELEAHIENPHSFVVPGATECSAIADYARTVARRAERTLVRAARERTVTPPTLAYVNRLSSFLYALARFAAIEADAAESKPTY